MKKTQNMLSDKLNLENTYLCSSIEILVHGSETATDSHWWSSATLEPTNLVCVDFGHTMEEEKTESSNTSS